jgi:hypothetical protein
LKAFKADDVVLDNYFYATDKNIFKDFHYSEKEIALILNLTDGEYADLIQKFLSYNPNAAQQNSVNEGEEIKNKIAELEKKLNNSRNLEEGMKKIPELEGELKKTRAELAIFQEFSARQSEAEKEFGQFAHLAKYNLNKIHEDLVHIEERILELEQVILNSKKEHIRYNAKRTQYDKTKVGIAIFWTIAVIILSIALYALKLPIIIVSVGALAGFAISFFILYTAKAEIEYPTESPDHVVDSVAIQQEIEDLKNKRIRILNLIGAHSTDEFFQIKATFMSFTKKLDYINDQKKSIVNTSVNYEDLAQNKDKIESELNDLKQIQTSGEQMLTPEQYLTVRREVDNLRLRLNQQSQTQGLGKDEIKKKLDIIRNELSVKIPDYINILQQTLKSSFANISSYFSELASKFSTDLSPLDETGNNYEQFTNFNKTLLQYALIKEIYKENFVFVIQYISSWNREDVELLSRFITSNNPGEAKFYIIDKDNSQ